MVQVALPNGHLTAEEVTFIKELWVPALRSGEFIQGLQKLCSYDDGIVDHHCCLGVGLVKENFSREYLLDVGMPGDIDPIVGNDDPFPGVNTHTANINGKYHDINTFGFDRLNDRVQMSFDQIADLLEHMADNPDKPLAWWDKIDPVIQEFNKTVGDSLGISHERPKE